MCSIFAAAAAAVAAGGVQFCCCQHLSNFSCSILNIISFIAFSSHQLHIMLTHARTPTYNTHIYTAVAEND